jgi:hypothetical protein
MIITVMTTLAMVMAMGKLEKKDLAVYGMPSSVRMENIW